MKRTPAFLLLLAACSHSEPFTAPDDPLDGPFSPAAPVRLTYADGGPTAPIWMSGGDSILYSYTRRGGGFAVEQEGCLAILPTGGGSIRREICSRSVFPVQAGDFFDLPALSAGGRLAFFHDGQPAAEGTAAEAILAAPFATPSGYAVVRTFPFQGDVFYVGVTSIRWLDESRIAFVGTAEELFSPCPGCDPLLVRYDRAILLADPAAPQAATVVPGTLFATSVSPGESPDVIYYTIANDSRIYRQNLSSGAVATVHDFGAPTIVRDVSWADGRLVAIADGSVRLFELGIGVVQSQNPGGTIYVIDPGSGLAQAVATPQPMWFRRPALSPDGNSIVAEGAALQIDQIGDGSGGILRVDTIPGPSAIWRLAAP
ncbi:MAG TPA: hypothetical protein VFT04_03765 [Gemmatimonadales bacterium]|nr:hypothetical protein [Gemmatimonadales bacterium]